jgi:hypothetical protein
MKMKKSGRYTATVAFLAFAFFGCNKTSFYTNRLGDAEWSAQELSVEGVNQAELPSWDLSDCDPYEESCTGDWEIHGGKSSFIWQFRESAKKFEISNQSVTTGSHSLDEAVIQCQQFSGVYDVVESEKDEMEFTSTKTLGFPGKKVVIKITRGGHSH